MLAKLIPLSSMFEFRIHVPSTFYPISIYQVLFSLGFEIGGWKRLAFFPHVPTNSGGLGRGVAFVFRTWIEEAYGAVACFHVPKT